MMMKQSSETVSVGWGTSAEQIYRNRGCLASASHLQRVLAAEYIDLATLARTRFEKLALHSIGSERGGYETCPHGGRRVMRSGHFEWQAKLGAGALVVLMVHGFCAPARASCSHRVGTPSALISSLYGLDELILTGISSVSENSPGQSHRNRSIPGHRAPCSGLSCSGRVPLPISTALLVQDQSNQWGKLGARLMLDLSSLPAKLIEGTSPHSVRQSASIFHPPPV